MPAEADLDTGPLDRRELRELGERAIFRDMLAPRYAAVDSFGDDCAPFGPGLVVTTDSCPTPLVTQLGETDPFYVGWLLATINLSDLAAAGADPLGLMVNYTLPRTTPVGHLKRIIKGVDACAAHHRTSVLGGDMRDGPQQLSATAIGRSVRRRTWTRRSGRVGRRGAVAGDRLLLVGDPGYLWGSALLHHGYAHVDEAATADVVRRARQPIAQLRAGRVLAERGLSRAALDVSDGLYASVKLLCEANDVGAVMHPHIDLDPVLREICRQAEVDSFRLGQTWGDWCLLVAVRPADLPRAYKELRGAGANVREVGGLRTEPGLVVGTDDANEIWDGLDQERFTDTSWNGSGIIDHIEWMRKFSRFER